MAYYSIRNCMLSSQYGVPGLPSFIIWVWGVYNSLLADLSWGDSLYRVVTVGED